MVMIIILKIFVYFVIIFSLSNAKIQIMIKRKTERAYFAGGCFWCLEASFRLLPGVISVISGYAGGNTENPTYEQVSAGETNHAETVEIEYDPEIISYKELLKIFFMIHDPSAKNRQGADIGTQYRSVIFYATENQKNEAKKIKDQLEKSKEFPRVTTELLPLKKFWPAEEYHQNYFEKNPSHAYCQRAIKPKTEKIEKYLSSK